MAAPPLIRPNDPKSSPSPAFSMSRCRATSMRRTSPDSTTYRPVCVVCPCWMITSPAAKYSIDTSDSNSFRSASGRALKGAVFSRRADILSTMVDEGIEGLAGQFMWTYHLLQAVPVQPKFRPGSTRALHYISKLLQPFRNHVE